MNKELVLHLDSKSVVSEAIKMARTNIEYSKTNKNLKTILVTSSMPGEGKSFISSNLAVSFAQLDKKVIIIDCDLRKGRLHKIFEKQNIKGMSELLRNNEVGKLDDYKINTGIKNLDLITRGKVPLNPSELLTYKTTNVIFEELKKYYDVIIIDGTPIIGLSDSLILAKKVDMVTMVSSLSVSTTETVATTKKALDSVNANLIGVIANRIPKAKSLYYKYD